MGYVQLPALPPPGGGRMSGTIVLERHELLETLDLLKAALREYTQGAPTPLPISQPGFMQPVPRPTAVPLPQAQYQQFPPQQYQPQPQVRTQQPQIQSMQQQMAQVQLQREPQVRPPVVVTPQPQGPQQLQPQIQQPQVRASAAQPQPQPRPAQQYAAAPGGPHAAAAAAPDGWPAVPQAAATSDGWPTVPPAAAAAADRWSSATPAPAPAAAPAGAAPDRWSSATATPAPTAAPQAGASDRWDSATATPAPAPAPAAAPAAAPDRWASATATPAPAPAAAPAAAAPDRWASATATPAPAPAASPAAAASSRWQMVFTSESDDHSNVSVTAMAYAQSLPGLPGGDGHAGWLISASKGVLNLWETNRAASGHEMALMCMHSQAVDVVITKLVLEPSIKLCFGAALGTGSANECVSVHSLDTESLLASRYKFAPPPDRSQAPQRLMQQVEALHGMSPSLRNHAVVSYGERLLLFQTKPEDVPLPERQNAQKYTRTGSVLHNPETHFVAHPGSVITALHRSPLEGSCLLVSGAKDGKVYLWDMKTPPKSPISQMVRHTKTITGLSLVSDDRLATSSLDGSVLLWDLRSTGSPLYKSSAPGGAAVLKIASGPWGDVLAVSTTKGLHCLELFDFESPMTNITAYPLQKPFTDIIFNTVTHDLYAGCANGSIQVFSRQA